MSRNPVLRCTFTGRQLDLVEPDPADVCIEDIAHALAHLCRYTGHTRGFYSVAQHSVLISRALPPHLRLQGLLHDAHEAYIGDWSAPLKAALPPAAKVELKAIEDRIIVAISEALGVELGHHPLVKFYDNMALRAEAELLLSGPLDWTSDLPRSTFGRFLPWPADKAEARFLQAFEWLTSESTAIEPLAVA